MGVATMTHKNFSAKLVLPKIKGCGLVMLRFLLFLGFLGPLIAPAAAQDVRRSECLAMAEAQPRATPVSLRRMAAKAEQVAITYAGHSTYYIDTPGGVR